MPDGTYNQRRIFPEDSGTGEEDKKGITVGSLLDFGTNIKNKYLGIKNILTEFYKDKKYNGLPECEMIIDKKNKKTEDNTMNKIMNLKKQLIVTVDCDEWFESPRDDRDNLGTLYTWEDGYFSPDRQNFSDGLEFLVSIIGEELIEKIYNQYNDTGSLMDDITKRLDKLGYILYPVSKYEHSGVIYSIGVSGGWHSGDTIVGVIFAEKKKICEWFNTKKVTQKVREKVVQNFESELEIYTDYANGYGMYCVEIEEFSGEQVEIVGGYYKPEHETIEQCLDLALDLVSDLGEISEWKEFDQEEIDEKFLIETVTTVKAR